MRIISRSSAVRWSRTNNGAQALTQAAAYHPDVVLMDLRMPGMDGIEATRALRQQHPSTPVVLWTGDDAAQLDRAIGKSGAQVGVLKGVDMARLATTLQAVCCGYATKDARWYQDG